MKTILFTFLAALLLLATSCMVYDPYLYPGDDYYYGYPGYPAYSTPGVVIGPPFGLYAPWYGAPYYYRGYGYYGGRGYHRGPYGYYGGHGYYHGGGGHGGHGGRGGHH